MSRQMRATTVVSQAGDIVGRGGVGAQQPQPSLLHGILGFGGRAEHPIGDRLQARARGGEPLAQDFFLVHRHIRASQFVTAMTILEPPM